MKNQFTRTLPILGLWALALTSLSAHADEPSPSLYEKRLGIIKGTSKGIVVWGSDSAQPATAGTANAANAGTSGNKSALASPDAPQQSADKPAILNTVAPPSGRSLNDARRLGAVGGGITLPTKATQAAPSEAAAKP